MSFTIKGQLCGYLCRECIENLSGVTVRFYRPVELNQQVAEQIAADPKATLQLLTPELIAAKKDRLIGETQTDEKGDYQFEFPKAYDGGPVEIDVFLSGVPNQKIPSKDEKSVQFALTTLQPKWRETNEGMVFAWKYCINARFWCAIRALFDAWVICGYVTTCGPLVQPIVGVEVFAYDDDWITDDLLGSAVTNSAGFFRIDYSSRDFKQTFLSPWINVETPILGYSNGPDVYFKIESSGGTIIYEEPSSMGRTPARDNIGSCFCVDLCVDDIPNEIPVASAWTGIGTSFTIPVGADLNDFDTDGYAGTGKYGFTRTIRMTGQAAVSNTNKILQGNPIEYRFLVSGTTSNNGDPYLPATDFDKIVDGTTGLFAPTRIGQMWYFGSPFRVINIYAVASDLDSEGWLDVSRSVVRTFTALGLDPLDLTDPIERELWEWIDLDGMMAIDTSKMTAEANVSPSGKTAGDIVPVAERIGIEKMAIRFEIREVIDAATDTYSYLPGSGQTLNSMVINNNPTYKKLNVTEHLTGGGVCSVLTGDLHMAYTVHHPHLQNVRIRVESNDGAINTLLSDPSTGLTITGNTSALVNHLNNGTLGVTGTPNSLSLHTCNYIAKLQVLRRLHTGDGHVSWEEDDTAFYYEA
jgi:hypothetical protein